VNTMARRRADQALAFTRERPESFGAVLLAVRALALVEDDDDLELQGHVRRFVSAWGGAGLRAGEVLVEAVQRSTPLQYARQEPVYREGEPSSDLFVVAEGAFDVERRGLGVVDQLNVGDVFGEGGLVAGARRLATVRASRGAHLLILNLQQADRLTRHLPKVGAWLRQLHRERVASQVLPQRSPLHQLDVPRRERLLDALARHRAPSNAQLLTQDKVATQFGIVLSGVADITRRDASGQTVTVDRLVPGDLFGARSLLTGAPSPVTMLTRGTLDYVALDAGMFVDLMDLWPDVRRRLEVFVHARWGFGGPTRTRASTVERQPLDPEVVARTALDSTGPIPAMAPALDDIDLLLGGDDGPLDELGGDPAGGGVGLSVMTCPFCLYQQVEADRCSNCGALMPWAPLP
jgi:CRP-like cAMP-binding protein